MDSLDNDTASLILKQIPVLERLQLYNVLNTPKPSQYQVSYELISSKGFRGKKGLLMRAFTTGDSESCDYVLLMIQNIYKLIRIKYNIQPEEGDILTHLLTQFKDHDPYERTRTIHDFMMNIIEFKKLFDAYELE